MNAIWVLIIAIFVNGHIEVFPPVIYPDLATCEKKIAQLVEVSKKREGMFKNSHVDLFCYEAR